MISQKSWFASLVASHIAFQFVAASISVSAPIPPIGSNVYVEAQVPGQVSVSTFPGGPRPRPGPPQEELVCYCGYLTFPKTYGSFANSVREAAAAAVRPSPTGDSATDQSLLLTVYQCLCSQKWNGGNFKELEIDASSSAVKYQVPGATPPPANSCDRPPYKPNFNCFCGYFVFPQTYGSLDAAVSVASNAAIYGFNENRPSSNHPLGDYNYLISHYNLTDYQCLCLQSFYGGDVKELEEISYSSAVKYGVPQATRPPYGTSNRYPGKFKCGCGYLVFPKTYKTMDAAVREASFAATRDLRFPTPPSGNLSTYELTDYQCLCSQSWYGGNFKVLVDKASMSADKYGVPEATAD